MTQPDIYTSYIIAGFTELFNTMADLMPVQVVGYPKSVQVDRLVAHIYDGMEQRSQGQIITRDYRTIHRCYVLWQDWAEAEAVIATINDRVASAIIEHPTLFGRIATNGLAMIPNCVGGHVLPDLQVRTGFTDFGDGSRYRIIDLTTTTKVKFAKLGLEG